MVNSTIEFALSSLKFNKVEGEDSLLITENNLYVYIAPIDIEFSIIQKPREMLFTELCDEQIHGADIACNGPIFSVPADLQSAYNDAELLSPEDVTTNGLVYSKGSKVDGRSSPTGFYVNQDRNRVFHFGEGDPPNPYNAISGLTPLIINDYRPNSRFSRPVYFGERNVYDNDAERNVEQVRTGDPAPEHEDNLIQRSNLALTNYNRQYGIMSLGVSERRNACFVVFKEPGVMIIDDTIGSAMDIFRFFECENALVFDGAFSITARTRKKYYAIPAEYKDSSIEIGFTLG